MKRLCVFCASRMGRSPAFAAAARDLGALLARRGVGLVYGGGNIGLMGVLADAVLAGGGEVIGVMPKGLVEREVAHAGLGMLHVVDTMTERKEKMIALSDAFMSLPGAYGTLDEMLEVLTLAQLDYHAKPSGLLNVDGFYDHFLAQLRLAEAEDFLHVAPRAKLTVDTDPARLLDTLLDTPR